MKLEDIKIENFVALDKIWRQRVEYEKKGAKEWKDKFQFTKDNFKEFVENVGGNMFWIFNNLLYLYKNLS